MKTCTKCGTTSEYSCFYKRDRSPDGYEAWCKVCRLKHNREWRDRNPEKHKELVRKNHSENKAHHAAQFKRRYEKDKARYLAKYYRRVERIQIATPAWANQEAITDVYRRARVCSEYVGMKYDVDHIVPLQGKTVCGLHVENNLQVITAKENKSKFNTTWPDMP